MFGIPLPIVKGTCKLPTNGVKLLPPPIISLDEHGERLDGREADIQYTT